VIIFEVKLIVLFPADPAVVPRLAFRAKFAVSRVTFDAPNWVKFKVDWATVKLFDALEAG
jgi:hypothetical protein